MVVDMELRSIEDNIKNLYGMIQEFKGSSDVLEDCRNLESRRLSLLHEQE